MNSRHTAPRIVRGTERRVRVEGDILIKEFRRVRWPGDLRRPWAREHNALRRLEATGIPLPRSHGFVTLPGGTILYRREYLAGTMVEHLTEPLTRALADHLAAIHQAGVLTCDPSMENLLLGPDGRLVFIDFGRSRIFRWRSLLFYFYVGKELVRCDRNLRFADAALFSTLLFHYFAALPAPPCSRAIIKLSMRYWRHRWAQR